MTNLTWVLQASCYAPADSGGRLGAWRGSYYRDQDGRWFYTRAATPGERVYAATEEECRDAIERSSGSRQTAA